MKLIVPIVAIFLSTGCMLRSTPVVNSIDVSDVDWTNVDQMKHGSACATYLFGAIGIGGTTSLVRAVENAGITKVNSAGTRYKNWLIVSQSCVEVWGE